MSNAPPRPPPSQAQQASAADARSCRRKQPYPTRARARLSLRNHPPTLANKLSVYHCTNCQKYHLGRPQKRLERILDSLPSTRNRAARPG